MPHQHKIETRNSSLPVRTRVIGLPAITDGSLGSFGIIAHVLGDSREKDQPFLLTRDFPIPYFFRIRFVLSIVQSRELGLWRKLAHRTRTSSCGISEQRHHPHGPHQDIHISLVLGKSPRARVY
jgi:hypothetical protein